MEHRKQLWFGRVELFFRCSFQSAAGGRVFDLDLAVLSFLYDNYAPCPLESVMQNWQVQDKSPVRNDSIGETLCRTDVRVFALVCKFHQKL